MNYAERKLQSWGDRAQLTRALSTTSVLGLNDLPRSSNCGRSGHIDHVPVPLDPPVAIARSSSSSIEQSIVTERVRRTPFGKLYRRS